MKIKDILIRAVAGILYILVILFGILGGRYSFLGVFGIILGIALFEFYRMVEKDTSHDISKVFNIISGVLIFLALFIYLEGYSTLVLPAIILLYLLILIASAIFLRREDILHGIIYSGFGQIYITMPLCMLMLIFYSNHSTLYTGDYQRIPILALFVFLWVNDTAAYFIGSLIGKHKLMEHISPKKSTEGFIAGIIFTIIAALVFAHLFPSFTTVFWVGFGVVVSLFGTLGDLFESLIKRTCNIKDSGTFIPGHGGILDRIDSLLLAVPAVYFYLLVFESL